MLEVRGTAPYNRHRCWCGTWPTRREALSTLTAELVDLIRAKPIEREDLTAASHYVLDTVACVLAGRSSAPGRILHRWFDDTGNDLGRKAFLASGFAHTLEIDDLHRASVTHPGCIVVPVAWYLAHRQGASGRDFLTAVLHGYEALARVGMAAGPSHYQVWHNTSTCGPFGSAMAAATLLELDREHTVWALGNAGTQASGLWQFLADDAMSKHLHTARAAEAGLVAATLSSHGFTGATRILEGKQGFFRALCPDPNPEALVAEPQARWQLRETSMKPWPCCRHVHPSVDAALELHQLIGEQPPVSVEVRTYQAALDVCDRPSPQTPYSAKFSLQHCVNLALADGNVDFDSFEAADRARLVASSANTSVTATPEFDDAYPQRWGAEVSVRLASGHVHTITRRACKGDPELPLDAQEIAEKARMVMYHGDLDQGAADVINEIQRLPETATMPRFPLSMTGDVQ